MFNSYRSGSVFSKLKNILLPVYGSEFKKFFLISFLMFFILFNQNVLRILKDTIVISELNAEVLSFIKLYCMTPIAAICLIIYIKLLEYYTLDKVFYYFITAFTVFYLIFVFILYPNAELIHISANKVQEIGDKYPYLKWYILLFGNWSYILFYSLSELWGNIFYVLFFWQFVNEIIDFKQAKRFYTLFAFIGNSSLVLVGIIMIQLSDTKNYFNQYFVDIDSKFLLSQISVSMLACSSIISCIILSAIIRDIKDSKLLKNSNNIFIAVQKKMNLSEGFKYISKSKYLWLMLICSASFSLSIDLVEGVWKSKIKELYPSINEYALFTSTYILWTGVVIMIITVIGNNLMRRYSWFVTAVITPIIIMSTGSIFFFLVIFEKDLYRIVTDKGLLILPLLSLSVFIGAVQNVLSKGVKYSIWDSSLQMLYIPLNVELKTKGKAAVDVISPKLGKSLSGLIQSLIFTFTAYTTYGSISYILMILFVIVCVIWIYSVYKVHIAHAKICL
ncbi:Npt1/Npt2 family nucleotide transporter [Rickettsia endosymbiont of Cardiosporidium cionae]|uniref:Npt1/Npt2 family nucleotide transporter n=1 Tax=Rickettsia endosymbiont of Cardiosporidium cionae TaxID=2777155 RepID=UPI00189319B5|nr:Npt1/Npt2 family nucleotide transporter [Rickettsia endosymbiont of Cardiosporidium cionae]KAF8818406.1 GTP/GDP exchange transporter Tlc5 [Rickettsia endosymbiont of Cardiosporidium cionae]